MSWFVSDVSQVAVGETEWAENGAAISAVGEWWRGHCFGVERSGGALGADSTSLPVRYTGWAKGGWNGMRLVSPPPYLPRRTIA